MFIRVSAMKHRSNTETIALILEAINSILLTNNRGQISENAKNVSNHLQMLKK